MKNTHLSAFSFLALVLFATLLGGLSSVAAHIPSETVSTRSTVHVLPNPVGLNQQVSILIQVEPSPPTATFDGGDRWLGITVAITKPDGTRETLGPFTSNASGMVSIYYHPFQSGTHTFVSSFPGQTLKPATTIGNPGLISDYVNDTFLPSTSNPFTLTVQQQPIETSTPSPNPFFTPQPTPTPRPAPQLSTIPSVPEFSLRYVPPPYNVITKDPYTGANISQRVESSAVEIMIKNPPFSPYHDAASDSDISVYYNIRTKGHFGTDWQELYSSPNLLSKSDYEYTVVPYFQNLPPGSQIDFQVKAIIGSWAREFTSDSNNPGSYQNTFAVVASSDWSTMQTAKIPEPLTSTPTFLAPSNPPTPTQTPTTSPIATFNGEQTSPTVSQTPSQEPVSQPKISELYFIIAALAVAVGVLVILASILTARICKIEKRHHIMRTQAFVPDKK